MQTPEQLGRLLTTTTAASLLTVTVAIAPPLQAQRVMPAGIGHALVPARPVPSENALTMPARAPHMMATDGGARSVAPQEPTPAKERMTAMASIESTAASRAPTVHAPIALASNAMTRALQEYRIHGVAPVVTSGPVTIYPFDQGEAVLTCAILRACLVELEPGEQVVDEPIAGDQARWIIGRAKAGLGGRIALVVVKPKACDITTNLIIPTDRRIYDLTLEAPPCASRGPSATNPKQPYLRHVRFYFPADSLAPPPARRDTADRLASAALRPTDTTSSYRPLNHAYRVERVRHFLFWHRWPDFPWRPTAIADDGLHVYIGVPSEARQHPEPVLFALEDDGSRALINYATRTRGDTTELVTDRVFHHGQLVIVSGTVEHTLELVNEAWGRTPASESSARQEKR